MGEIEWRAFAAVLAAVSLVGCATASPVMDAGDGVYASNEVRCAACSSSLFCPPRSRPVSKSILMEQAVGAKSRISHFPVAYGSAGDGKWIDHASDKHEDGVVELTLNVPQEVTSAQLVFDNSTPRKTPVTATLIGIGVIGTVRETFNAKGYL
jgi:hypothetical protein